MGRPSAPNALSADHEAVRPAAASRLIGRSSDLILLTLQRSHDDAELFPAPRPIARVEQQISGAWAAFRLAA